MPKLRKSGVWKFSTIPTSVFESDHLTIYDKMTLACLLWHGDGDLWPSIPRLSRMAGCGVRAIRESIKRLIEFKVLRVVAKREGFSHVFRLDREPTPPEKWLSREEEIPLSEKQGSPIQKAGPPLSRKHTNESNLNESNNESWAKKPPTAPSNGTHQAIADWSDTYFSVVKKRPMITGKHVGILKRMTGHYGAECMGPMMGNFFHPLGKAVPFTIENFHSLGDKLYQEIKGRVYGDSRTRV